jgi:peptidoglycan/LPS O-acetylase OafA/YrhL
VSSGFRPEIQALRAVAVIAVVLFHFWPDRVPGGYIGVDVFFVISGFLISSHLLRESEATGRIGLKQFYARRIRRLLPASMLVLAVTLVATVVLLTQTAWRQILPQIAASAAYFVNWVLAATSVDYFAEDNDPSPVQHYWSLSVEEQFYLVWPLLIIVTLAIAKKVGLNRTRALLFAFCAILVLGLAYSIIFTPMDPSFTYFATPAHAWEFAAGGLLALLAGSAPLQRWDASSPRIRGLVSWAGFVLIAVSAFIFNASTPFPGYAALLPVVGALAVIGTQAPRSLFSPRWLVDRRAVQFLGDNSYSLYLWHWPLIVLLPAAIGHDLTLIEKVITFAVAIALAWLTRRFVEDPVRTATVWRRSRVTFGAAVAASAAVLIAAIAPVAVLDSRRAEVTAIIESAVENHDPCVGAPALTSGADCAYATSLDPRIGTDVHVYVAPPAAGDLDGSCHYLEGTVVDECIFGYSNPDEVIAVVGDSHVNHYLSAISALLGDHRWQIRIMRHNACPAVGTEWSRSRSGTSESSDHCVLWRQQVVQKIAAMSDVDLVIASNYTQKYSTLETAANRAELAKAFAATWSIWTSAGRRVLVVADDPLTNKQVVPECVERHQNAPDECGLPRSKAVGNDALVAAVQDYPNEHVSLLDLTPQYCDETLCHVVVGGLVVYSDTHHLSGMFSRTLAPFFDTAITAALR